MCPRHARAGATHSARPLATHARTHARTHAHAPDRVHAVRHGEGVGVVHCAKVVSHLLCRRKIGRPLEPDAKRVQPWEVRERLGRLGFSPGRDPRLAALAALVVLGAVLGVASADGRYQRRVEATGEQYPPGHVTHHALHHRCLEVAAQLRRVVGDAGFECLVVPDRIVPPLYLAGLAAVKVPRQKLNHSVARVVQSLQF
jgi:hypothetical protein